MIASAAFADKHYAVLGLARSGLATVRALIASDAKVTAWDLSADARDKAAALGAEIGDPEEGDITRFEAIVLSPGVPLNRHPIAKKARDAAVPLIGDIQLFAEARAGLPDHRVVAITGTNGKSTTTALVHHILKASGRSTLMGGNIGIPIMEQQPLQPNDKGPGVYVLELSSYQIDLAQTFDADIAALLNITPDHLDRYDGFEDYAAAKARLFGMQSSDHAAIFCDGDQTTRTIGGAVRGTRTGAVVIGPSVPSGQDDWPALQGPHNAQNVAAAIAIVRALGLVEDEWRPALATFGGLPHRMEMVGESSGVRFVNDSKATNPASAAPALAAFPCIRWICGGQAKTDSLAECEPHFGHLRSAYTIGEAGELFARLLAPHVAVSNPGTLDEAVQAAAADAEAGDVVLFSPACASFDQFRDFEHRGDAFRTAVRALPGMNQEGDYANG